MRAWPASANAIGTGFVNRERVADSWRSRPIESGTPATTRTNPGACLFHLGNHALDTLARYGAPLEVQLLALNDFHGNLEPPTGSGGRIGALTAGACVAPTCYLAGGVEYLATELQDALSAVGNDVYRGNVLLPGQHTRDLLDGIGIAIELDIANVDRGPEWRAPIPVVRVDVELAAHDLRMMADRLRARVDF